MAHSSPLLAQFLLVVATLAWGLLPDAVAPRWREALRRDRMNDADYERMERGYYEHLLDAGRQLGAPAGPAPGRALENHVVAIPFDAGPLTLTVDDLREYVLKPGLSVIRKGVSWSTNDLGMHDGPYATSKPAHCLRIALVGDSIGAGWGVDDGRGFEPVLERTLDGRSRAAGGPSVEVLNFAVPGYAPGQRWENFGRVGWSMGIDLVVYEATLADPGWDERRLRGLLPKGIGWDSPMYRDALARTRARPGRGMDDYKEDLRPARWDLLAGVYRTIADDCRGRGVPSVWVLIPRVGKATDLARRSGVSAVVGLSDAFDGLDPEALAIDPSDYHPNAEGHARLASRLDAALTARPEVRRLWNGPGAGADPR
jgi:hypothetical protein